MNQAYLRRRRTCHIRGRHILAVLFILFLYGIVGAMEVEAHGDSMSISPTIGIKMVKMFKTSHYSNKRTPVEIVIEGDPEYDQWRNDNTVNILMINGVRAMAEELSKLGWVQKRPGIPIVTKKAGTIYVSQGVRGSLRKMRNVNVTYYRLDVCNNYWPCRGDDVSACNRNKFRDNLDELAQDVDRCVAGNTTLGLVSDNPYD